MFGEPGVEQTLVPNGVECGDDDVRRRHLVGFHFDLRDARGPRVPFSGNGDFVVEDGDVGLRRQWDRRDATDEVTQFLSDSQASVACGKRKTKISIGVA